MAEQKPLPAGRVFEKEVLGVTEEGQGYDSYPEQLTFRESMRRIISESWSLYAESVEKGLDGHNPTNPNRGKTSQLFLAVKAYLPRRVMGAKIPLNFFTAVGRTSLDRYYGVDALFWWGGAYVTIDLSMIPPRWKRMKTDFRLTPEDMVPDRLSVLGKNIAELLKERRKNIREREVRCEIRRIVDVRT